MTRKLVAFLCVIASALFPQNKGNLVIIGGGKIPDRIITRFVDMAGGKEAAFLIIPMASAEPEKSASSFAGRLEKAGAKDVRTLIANKGEADADSNLEKLKRVTGIFITGGDQSRLTEIFNGTRILNMLKEKYRTGAVIGGTSAGAAVMSGVMLTGNERVNADSSNAYNSIMAGNIETTAGFGFLTSAVVDQHFIKRKRLTRLLSVVLDNPSLLGIGIDESTAALVSGGRLEVLGESAVMLFDASASQGLRVDKQAGFACGNIRTHLLREGDSFDMNKRRYTGRKIK